MRLKKLTLALLGLSLSACSTYSIHSQSTTGASLDQKATAGLNALYSYPSYDFNGRFNVVLEANAQPHASGSTVKLDAQLERQVEAYLRTQKIKLAKQQKLDLYQAIAQQNDPKSSFDLSRFSQMMNSLLANTEFSYDGSVHYRQKMAALNLHYKYQAPNMKTEATIPLMVDFQNHKFYINYAGLMPYLVSQENQDRFAYVDFSKYKGHLDKVDYQNLINFLKQSTAVPYVLADAQQLSSVALTAQDKASGVVEKLRLNQHFEEMLLQQMLFAVVNKAYLQQSVFNEDLTKDTDQAIDAESKVDVTEPEQSVGDAFSKHEQQAYQSSTELSRLVEAHLYPDQNEDDADEVTTAVLEQVVEDATNAIDTAAAAAIAADDATDALSITECATLAVEPASITMGAATYCQSEFDMNVFKTDAGASTAKKDLPSLFELMKLSAVFEQYDTKQFVDAQAFKALWVKHRQEIKAALAQQKTNVVVTDTGLDAQGRAIKIDYSIDYDVEKYGRIKFTTDMNILNYGNATPISQRDIKAAKTFKQMSQGSIFEDLSSNMSAAIGLDDVAGGSESVEKKTFNAQLRDLAKDTYQQTQSYRTTYQAVYIMKLTMEQPQVVKHYSAQKLSEIAQIYAYSYADESIYNPQGKALLELEKLIKIHDLQKRSHYDDDIGEAVYEMVESVMADQKNDQDWNSIVKQYKQPKAVFVQYYMKKFLLDNEVDLSRQAQFKATAEVLAQAYVDSKNSTLSAKTVANLKQDADDFIDYDLYRETFGKMLKQFK